MRVLVTGANGFIAKNLLVHLSERHDVEVVVFTRENTSDDLDSLVANVDYIIHLAGVNRPQTQSEFTDGNTGLTQLLCKSIEKSGKTVPVIYTSSVQAQHDNVYGESKLAAEQLLLEMSERHGNQVLIFRLPNVFGKWCKPNYNSVVATFCHNIANNLPIQINDPQTILNVVYVDDVVSQFIALIDGALSDGHYQSVSPVYEITLGTLAEKITAYASSRERMFTERVGTGLERALYSTYLSYLQPEDFSYPVKKYGDERGVFVEMLKTYDSGQFSFFTAHPGITRGGHYHHTKTEKFLVIKGDALFKFRQVLTGEYFEKRTKGSEPVIVETIPGWTHDITNIGDEDLIVMLWANEVFDRDRPDTYARSL